MGIIEEKIKMLIALQKCSKIYQVHFKEVEKYSFAKATQINSRNDTISVDTVPIFLVNFNETIIAESKPEKRKEIAGWLKVRLNIKNLEVLEY